MSSNIPIYDGAHNFTLNDELETKSSNGSNFNSPSRNFSSLPQNSHRHRKFHTSSTMYAITTDDIAKINELRRQRKVKNTQQQNTATKTKKICQTLSSEAKERKVPATRLGRLSSFGGFYFSVF